MDPDAASNEGMVAFNRQVVDGASAQLSAIHNWTQVTVFIHQAIISTQRADLNKGVELVQHPVVRCGIQHCTAPHAVAHNALAFVLMDLEHRGLVQLALIVKAQHQAAGLQLINPASAIRHPHQRIAKKATAAAATRALDRCHIS